ncbi:MAG: hypothetical protein H6673_04440 [Anaerolineales bacterium]|nr:hypothetical protein [Anaerolineales bacterium]
MSRKHVLPTQQPKNKNQPPPLLQVAQKQSSVQLTPQQIQRLQRTHGNRSVQRLLSQQHSPAIQRVGRTRARKVGNVLTDDPGFIDLAGTIGDYLGTDPTQGLSIGAAADNASSALNNGTGNAMTGMGLGTVGQVMSVTTGSIGTAMGLGKVGMSAKDWYDANKELETHETAYKGGDKALFATVELLKRKRSAAQKGTAEGIGSIASGVSGIINGATQGVTAAVAFSVGAALGMVVSTINAIRDFFNAVKRGRAQSQVGNTMTAYMSLMGSVEQTMNDKKQQLQQHTTRKEDAEKELLVISQKVQQINTLRTSGQLRSRSSSDIQKITQGLQTLRNRKTQMETQRDQSDQQILALGPEILQAEQKFDKIDAMRRSLAVSHRKLGFKSKITSGVTNLVGAGGAAALFAATLGAGAAAGPVGWVLSGIAIVGALSFFIGMAVKRSIRKSNVTRMNAEKVLVDEYIQSGTIAGQAATGASADADTRKKDIWRRDMFTGKGGVTAKGWFNNLISKNKSGKLTMEERQAELKAYLEKYDKGAAGDTVFDGIRAALLPGDEGDQMVDNPKHNPQKPVTGVPAKVTLRTTIEDLLKHFFGGNADDMKQSIISTDPTKQGKAKELLLDKMKLG